MPDLGLRSTFEACALVDELGSDAVGELAVGGREGRRGTVFIERGRICWAAARGLSRRLTELLGARSGLSSASLEAEYANCKVLGVPIGEHLVHRGVLSASELRAVLLTHTLESLRFLCVSDSRCSWSPRPGNGYSPRFTFTTSELLTSFGALEHGALADRLQPALAALFGEGEWGAAFARTDSSAFPEPIAMTVGAPAEGSTLLRVGKWAANMLDLAGAFTDRSALIAVERCTPEGPTSYVTFHARDAVVVGQTGAHGPARILNRRAQRRRKGATDHADL